MDLDVDLARKQSRENPVYYIQYAHARIASMLRRLPRSGLPLRSAPRAGGATASSIRASAT